MSFHVIFQSARLGGSKVALVTSERSFSCVLLHNVDFQITSCGARKLAHCTSMWLFTRVRLQVACCCCSIFALIAIKQFFPSVPLDMRLEGGSSVAGEVALCAPVRFLLDVNEGVPLQTAILTKWLIALLAIVRRVNKRVPLQVSIPDK